MTNDKRLTGEFVVHDYGAEDHDKDRESEVEGLTEEGVEHDGRADVLADATRKPSRLASALRSMSIRLWGAVSATTADNMIAHAAEGAAASADALAQTIEEDGLEGIGDSTVDFVRSNSRAVAASVAALGLIAVEAWRRGGRRSRS